MKYKDGIILVDKPSGPTSHDMVDIIRKKFSFKKVGHAGTLDPMATGLLVVLLGGFTKRSIQFSGYDKEYEATLRLGVSTDTADKEGKVVEEKGLEAFKEVLNDLKEVFLSFKGETLQVPPMYSAKKIKGKKLYELARQGIEIKREPRKIHISEIKVLDISVPLVKFSVRCSKGTYIRQLAHDIGEKIGCGAHLVSLRRTGIGPFNIKEAVAPDELKNENILQPE